MNVVCGNRSLLYLSSDYFASVRHIFICLVGDNLHSDPWLFVLI